MEHIFHKIILNIYFDHIYITCLYRVFSVLCTSYMLVKDNCGGGRRERERERESPPNLEFESIIRNKC